MAVFAVGTDARMPDTEIDLIDVLETAPVGAVILDDHDQQVLFWNTSVLAILGGLQGEAFARAATRGFFHEAQDFAEARRKLDLDGHLRNFETRIWREDGEETWAAVSMRAIRFEARPATLVWYFDVTGAKRRQHQLERSQDALLEVLDAAPTGAALTDGPERICYWNAALLAIFSDRGEDPSPAIRAGVARAHAEIAANGQGTTFRLPPYAPEYAAGREALERDAADRAEGQDSGEEDRFVEAWKFAVEFEGAPAELVWLHDVPELHRAERSAQAATETKSAFLATMSHEIRTPMNGVLAIAELLMDTPLEEEQARMVRIVQQSAESLLRVINDILDFSKLESSQMQVEAIQFDLEEVLDGVIQLLRPKAAEKGLALALRQRGTGGTARIGDPLRLRQVLLNLVGNAIKFTQQGSVTLEADASGEAAAFRIVDTGIGIPPDRLGKLFKPYAQADAATARNYGGTGLGLSISKALLALMGGGLRASSSVGSGSVFTATLPLPRGDTALPAHAGGAAPQGSAATAFWEKGDRRAAEAAGAVILCAEDNPTNRDVLARVLDRLGFFYEMAEDGIEAMAMLDRTRHGMMVTDGHMPRLDGWKLARAVREAEARDGLPRLPVALLTADAVTEFARRQGREDFDAHLTKPLRRDQLEAAVLAALPVLGAMRTPRKADAAKAVVPVAVAEVDIGPLVDLVGDCPDDLREILTEYLRGAEAQVEGLRNALHSGRRDAFVMAAHTLKGASAYAGASGISAQARALEEKSADGAILDTLRAAVEALAESVATLPAAIEASLAGLGEPALAEP
jgi:PAS domain S-box-containing protein